MTECPRCYQSSRHIPAGVTSTGREYRDFYVCGSGCVDTTSGRGLTWTTERQWWFLRNRAAEPRVATPTGAPAAFVDILAAMARERVPA